MSWLRQEYERVDEGFYVNRNIIEKAHRAGELSVLLHHDGGAIAFMVGWDILEVRPDMRGLGHGKTLAKHHIEQARSDGTCVLNIECNPPSSIPFWKKMGFTMFSEDDDDWESHAFMVLNKCFELPNDLPPVSVSLSFFPESKMWKSDTEPVVEFSPNAVQVTPRKIALSDRVICFDRFEPLGPDAVLGVIVDGKQVYLDKVGYDTAAETGVQRDSLGTYFVDYILTG